MSRFPLPRLPSWPYLAPRQELGEAAPAPYVMRCTWEHSQAIIKTLALHCTEHFLAIMRPATCVCSGHWWAGAPGLGTVSLAKYYLAFSWLGTLLTLNCFSAQVLNFSWPGNLLHWELLLLVSSRDAKSCRCCRYICAIFFQLVLIFGPFWVIFGPFWQFWVIFGP